MFIIFLTKSLSVCYAVAVKKYFLNHWDYDIVVKQGMTFLFFSIFLNIYWTEYFDSSSIQIEAVRIWSFPFQNFQAPGIDIDTKNSGQWS